MKEIRNFIKAELRKIDASLSEHESEMNFEQLPATKLNNLYRLIFGEFENTQADTNYFEDSVDVELMLYRPIEKRVPGTYDRSIEFIKKVRASLVSPKNYHETIIARVAPLRFSVAEYEGNGDIYEIKLNLTFTVSNSL